MEFVFMPKPKGLQDPHTFAELIEDIILLFQGLGFSAIPSYLYNDLFMVDYLKCLIYST
jgi:hypothetical protein